MLKAECAKMADEFQPCGYTVRLSAKWATLGAICPKHGPMVVEIPEPTDVEETEAEQPAELKAA